MKVCAHTKAPVFQRACLCRYCITCKRILVKAARKARRELDG